MLTRVGGRGRALVREIAGATRVCEPRVISLLGLSAVGVFGSTLCGQAILCGPAFCERALQQCVLDAGSFVRACVGAVPSVCNVVIYWLPVYLPTSTPA